MTSTIIALLLTACAPQDAEVSGSWHVWLAANNSATADEGELDLEERATRIYECKRGWDDERDDFEIGYIGPRTQEDRDSGKYYGGACDPDDSSCDQGALDDQCDDIYALEYYTFLQDDGYYYLTEPLDTWRSEALINGEGDFQLTVHNKLGNGQDLRFNFVIEPGFAPLECVDTDGDGVASAEYQDGQSWTAAWSDDEDGHTLYYLNAGAYQVEPTGSSGGIGSSDDAAFWYFTSEWAAGFSHAKYAAEEFIVRPTDYGRYDEAGDGPNFNLVEDYRNQCAAGRSDIPPLADAGPNQHVIAGEVVQVDASATVDSDSTDLTWFWSVTAPAGSSASLLADTPQASFVTDVPGNYVVTLTVFDGAWAVTDTLTVTAEDPNHVPYCDAVMDSVVINDSPVSLDATATDVDGDDLEYFWTYVDPTGFSCAEGGTRKVKGSGEVICFEEFDGPLLNFTPDIPGEWQFVVEVTDPDGKSCTTDWSVQSLPSPASDSPPLCDAGNDLEVYYGDTAVLDLGTASDPDGGSVTYEWGVAGAPSSSTASVVMDDSTGASSLASITPDASGTYVLTMLATDDEGEICTSDVTLTVRNNPPLCDVNDNVYAAPGEVVTLSDNSLDDPEGNAASATWTLDQVPWCSTATLTDNGDGTATLDRDLGGFYKATYQATDGDKTCSRTVTVQSTCDEYYDAGYACHQDDADRWAQEISHMAIAGVPVGDTLEGDPAFSHKTESNIWRPIDDRDSGLDGWAEISSSWVRIADGSSLEEGGSASGDFQIFMQGFESSSVMMVEGTFVVDKIKKDAWAYPDLEEQKRDESGEAYCDGDTVDQ